LAPGILAGMHVQQTTTPSASVIVKAGKVLVTDPSVRRPRLLALRANAPISFALQSADGPPDTTLSVTFKGTH
jgi:hypothetical protein